MRRLVLLIAVLVPACNANPSDEPSISDAGSPPPSLVVMSGERSPTPCACAYVWEKRFGNTSNGQVVVPGLATDTAGGVLAFGDFLDAADLGDGAVTPAGGGTDLFLTRLDASGRHLWSKHFGDAKGQRATTVALADDGSTFLSGDFQGSLDFGAGPLVSVPQPGGAPTAFFAKLDAEGKPIWSKVLAGKPSGTVTVESTAIRGSELLIAGTFSGTVDFGGGALTSAGTSSYDTSLFVAKLTTNGDHVWSKSFEPKSDKISGSFGLHIPSVGLDAKGNAVLAGTFENNIDFGGGMLSPSSVVPDAVDDSFVVKLDTMGNHVWSKQLRHPRPDAITSAVVSAAGDVFIAGQRTHDEGEKAGIFLMRFDSAGAAQWARRFRGYFGTGPKIAIDQSGRLGMTGEYLPALVHRGRAGRPILLPRSRDVT